MIWKLGKFGKEIDFPIKTVCLSQKKMEILENVCCTRQAAHAMARE